MFSGVQFDPGGGLEGVRAALAKFFEGGDAELAVFDYVDEFV
jgi:hypothetical protein